MLSGEGFFHSPDKHRSFTSPIYHLLSPYRQLKTLDPPETPYRVCLIESNAHCPTAPDATFSEQIKPQGPSRWRTSAFPVATVTQQDT